MTSQIEQLDCLVDPAKELSPPAAAEDAEILVLGLDAAEGSPRPPDCPPWGRLGTRSGRPAGGADRRDGYTDGYSGRPGDDERRLRGDVSAGPAWCAARDSNPEPADYGKWPKFTHSLYDYLRLYEPVKAAS